MEGRSHQPLPLPGMCPPPAAGKDLSTQSCLALVCKNTGPQHNTQEGGTTLTTHLSSIRRVQRQVLQITKESIKGCRGQHCISTSHPSIHTRLPPHPSLPHPSLHTPLPPHPSLHTPLPAHTPPSTHPSPPHPSHHTPPSTHPSLHTRLPAHTLPHHTPPAHTPPCHTPPCTRPSHHTPLVTSRELT